MQKHLHPVESQRVEKRREKRLLPRFPFSFLTFKSNSIETAQKIFEVRDISSSGMRLVIKDGSHFYEAGAKISGSIRLKGEGLNVEGVVKWTEEGGLGVEFAKNCSLKKNIHTFLGFDNTVGNLRVLHRQGQFRMDFPTNLKYWLKSDGPFEMLVWVHDNGGISRFQVIFMDGFVEWREEEKGPETGMMSYLKSTGRPSCEEEFLLEFESPRDRGKIILASRLMDRITEDHLPTDVLDFLRKKMALA